MTTVLQIARQTTSQLFLRDVGVWPPRLQRMSQGDADLEGEAHYDRTTATVCASIRTKWCGLEQR